MSTQVSNPSGLVVICGRLQSSTFGYFDAEMRGTFDVITENDDWHDPTGQKSAPQIRWRAFARDTEAVLANPKSPARKYFEGYLIIEGTPIESPKRKGALLWRGKGGHPRKTIYLNALFVTEPTELGIEALENSITFYPQGVYYNHWWREDYIGEPIIDDYEFMYEDERWSRDPD